MLLVMEAPLATLVPDFTNFSIKSDGVSASQSSKTLAL